MNKTMIFTAALLIAAGFYAPASAGGCCDGVPAPAKRFLILSSGEQTPAAEEAEAAADQQAAPEAIAPASGEGQAAPAATPAAATPATEGETPAAITDEAQQPE
ncbi:MAG: hypothetical protein WBK55_04445 [Alphaproteobacteria bacterium]